MQVVWNAWLSTLGHAPMVDPSDFLHNIGADQVGEGLSNAISHAVSSPFVAHATAAVSEAASVSFSTLVWVAEIALFKWA